MVGIVLLAVVSGVGVGLVRGGSLRGLGQVRLRDSWLVLAAVAIRLLAPRLTALTVMATGWEQWIYPVADAVLVVFMILNVRLAGAWLAAIGLGANVLVRWLNGGKMPVARDLAARLGFTGEAGELARRGDWLHAEFIDAHTRVPFLGDIIYLGHPYPWPGVLSVGDLLLGLGVVMFVQGAMVASRKGSSPLVEDG